MDSDDLFAVSKPTIRCTEVPIKLLEKNAAKEHFSQFGKLVKLSLKTKLKQCSVQYDSRESAEFAIANAGYYQGESFPVGWDTKKKRVKKVADPDWELDPEVKAELEAMGEDFTVKRKFNLRPEVMAVDTEPPAAKKERKSIKRLARRSDRPTVAVSKPITAMNADKQELLSKLKQPAFTVEEKFRMLDTRDKLIRLIRAQKQIDISKTKRKVGTCPDMCPEKERLMREVQHQVAVYEQEIGERTMNHALAVKQYSRSSADQEAPLPHELRNVDVLQMTMDYLMRKIMNICDLPDTNLAEWYHFLWDRTRGIRKDITQQELCCQGSVELIEQCARFHIQCSARLVAEDTSVFDQKINTENLTKCLQTLKYMYHDLALKGEHCPNEPEFRAYVILLNLNDGNFLWEVQQLKPEIQKSQEIRFALNVYSAIDKNNYVKFFKLVRSTTYLNACILLRYFLQVRTRAISTIIKAFAPRSAPHTQYPLQELYKILAFEGVNSTIDFFEYFGLMVNDERTHIILDRQKYSTPDYPYMLDRAVAVIESKRNYVSVGEIVCGRLFSGEFKPHPVKSSFDENGYLDLSEFQADFVGGDGFKGVKLKPDVTPFVIKDRSNSPFMGNREDDSNNQKDEGKVLDSPGKIFSSITAQINKNADLFKPPLSEPPPYNIFATGKSSDLHKTTSSGQTLFNLPSDKNVPSETVNVDFFKKPTVNFAFNKVPVSDKMDLFSTVNTTSQNIFPSSKHEQTTPALPTNIFPPAEAPYTLFPPKDSTIFPKQKPIVSDIKFDFLKPPQQGFDRDVFDGRNTNFSQMTKTNTRDQIENIPTKIISSNQINIPQTKTSHGGFHFDFPPNKKAKEQLQPDEDKVRKLRENEMRHMREKAEEKENLRKLELKKKELQQKREEERVRKEVQIEHTVRLLIDDLISKVEEDYKKHRLDCLKENLLKRQVIVKWRKNIVLNKRKRKAIDQSPVWLSAKTQREVVSELFSSVQVASALDLRKRYKQGVSVNMLPEFYQIVDKIALVNLTGESLIRNLKQSEIYWKVNVVSEGINELVDKAFDDYLGWKENNGLKYLLQQHKLNTNKITYCIKKLAVKEMDYEADCFIFISNELSNTLLNRIYQLTSQSLSTPIALILQKYPENVSKLDQMVDEDIIKIYEIESGAFTRKTCLEYFNQALIFLASNTDKSLKSPQLDTLKSFLLQHLGGELWRRISSFAKWNNAYKQTLTVPETAINIHNDALDLIKQGAFSEECCQYPNFPEVFKDFLPSKIPNTLPCDYKYFPAFWKNPNYKKYVLGIINALKLPKYVKQSEKNLQQEVFNYCAKIFEKPQRVFYKVMAHVLKNSETVLWSDIVEIITIERINEIDFNLPDRNFSLNTVFNQLFIVYDYEAMRKFSSEPWFYITNSAVKKTLDESLNEPDDISDDEIEDYEVDFEKSFAELDKRVDDTPTVSYKKQLNNITAMMDDLEESMAIQRKISQKIQSTLQSFLSDAI